MIYLGHNKVNGKYYVGKTVKKNWRSYIRDCVASAMKGSTDKPRLYNAIRKYGADAFEWHPLMATLLTNEEHLKWEVFLIALFKAQDPNVGYNISDGGDGTSGFKWTPEQRANVSRQRKGRVVDWHCGYGYLKNRGRKHSAETKQAMSTRKQELLASGWKPTVPAASRLSAATKHRGMKRSEATRTNISKAWTPERRAELAGRNRRKGHA